MMLFTNPNDFNRPTDSGQIQKAIIEAKRSGCNQVVIPRMNASTGKPLWVIDETILLPSDITVILDNCHLRMADGAMCQMFCNENAHSPIGATREGRQENIRLIGRGNALLDGGEDNGLCEKTSNKNGFPHIMHNLTIFFRNVHNFTIQNLTIRDQRWWAICFLYSAFGKVSDIHFEISTRYERTAFEETGHWRNQDGIDLRVGCHDITIENITGETGDDVIAFTALAGPKSFEHKLLVEGEEKHIRNVSVRNVKASCNRCAIIRLLAHRRNQLYNITIDGVFVNEDAPVRPGSMIKLNDHFYYGDDLENKAKMGEMRAISIRNVFADATYTVIQFSGALCDISIRDVYVKGECCALRTGPAAEGTDRSNHFKDFLIESIHAKNLKEFECLKEENVVIRDVFEN